MKFLESECTEFLKTCVHPDAGEGQRQEIRAAFYAGATVAIQGLCSAVEVMTEEQSERFLQHLQAELAEFRAEIERASQGKAP